MNFINNVDDMTYNNSSKQARNKLKSWASNIITSIHEYNGHEFLEYKSMVTLIFSSVLLEKLQVRKLPQLSIHDLVQTKSWKYSLKIFHGVFPNIDTDHQNFSFNFMNDVLAFARDFVYTHYSDLDNILSWLYQYFNIRRVDNKHKDTQFFTDRYMVKFLVKSSLNNFSDDELSSIKIIDPACGGGNFIVEVIEEIHSRQKKYPDKILDIIQKNLYAYDIDPFLSYLCSINILIKLMELGVIKEILKVPFKFNVYSDSCNPFGALLKRGEKHQLLNVSTGKTIPYINIFNNQFHVVITNPPFKGKRILDSEVRDYLKKTYPLCKGDLCNAFLLRSHELLIDKGIGSFVSQNSWMFLDSYIAMRKYILTMVQIQQIVDLGSDSFCDLSGEKANVCLFSFQLKKPEDKFPIVNMKSLNYQDKSKMLERGVLKDYTYKSSHQDILQHMAYRIDSITSSLLQRALKQYSSYGEFGIPMQGTSTGDNNKYVAYQWEQNNPNWLLVSKGGGYCKWSGLNIFKVNWGSNGENIRKNPKSVIRNAQYFDSTDLVYSDTGTSGLSVRLLLEKQIFIASGPGIRIKQGDKFNHLAFLNSRIASFFIKMLTPKLTISAKYIGQIPVPAQVFETKPLRELAMNAVELKNRFNQKRAVNFEFQKQDYFCFDALYKFAINDLLEDLTIEIQRLEIEHRINSIIEKEYNLSLEDIKLINSVVGVSAYCIDKNQDFPAHDALDKEISMMLDCNCVARVARSSKQSLGMEGILECYAIKRGYSPVILKKYIVENVNEYKLTLLKYYKHLLHRIELCISGLYGKSEIDVSRYHEFFISDIKNRYVDINYESWFEKGLEEWHYNAFCKKPFIKKWSK